ncbi:hypothetical protein L1M59_11470 [Bacillus sp. ET1]|nr:hypothetical protein [Bacillus sp. ET1]
MNRVYLAPAKVVNREKRFSIHQDEEIIPKGVKMIGASEIWEKENKGEGVVIAVLDSGCDKRLEGNGLIQLTLDLSSMGSCSS